MIELVPLRLEKRRRFRVGGKIDSGDISRVVDVIEMRLERFRSSASKPR